MIVMVTLHSRPQLLFASEYDDPTLPVSSMIVLCGDWRGLVLWSRIVYTNGYQTWVCLGSVWLENKDLFKNTGS